MSQSHGIAGFCILVALGSGLSPAPPGPVSEGRQETSGCWVRGERMDLELRASPYDSSMVQLEGGQVKVCYSRPRTLGRPIMGRVVPYGDPWRLGANEATSIHIPFPAEIAGIPLEAGLYSLYAIPAEEEWRIVVNRTVERWGIPLDDKVREQDIGSATVPVERTEGPVELLTISFRRLAGNAAELIVEWSDTRVRIPIRAQQ